jgi:misacylated tRNA(Ala) deacylase
MTELAYLADLPSAYVRSFRARVTALPPGAVVLDRTYFYPTGGGQPADHGTLRDDAGHRFEVVDVYRSGAAAVHRVRAAGDALRHLTVGNELAGDIDWDRRYRHMRLHTGQHLTSALLFARTGRRTRRAEMADVSAVLDLDGALGPSELEGIAAELDRVVAAARPVSIRHVPRSEWDVLPAAGRSGLVPLPRAVDPVRVVEIEAADVCPCGGTHVRSTGEIGALRFGPTEALGGGGARVTFSLVDADRPTPSA